MEKMEKRKGGREKVVKLLRVQGFVALDCLGTGLK
ncbi:MAG: hypothetical protein ACI8X3_000917 [Saprospiraceae bacterium]|jgi:hypothetical protein